MSKKSSQESTLEPDEPERRGNKYMSRIFLLTFVVLMLACTFIHADSAEDMIAESGVKGGFVVHVGCGDGKLTTSFRQSDAYIVHGVDTDSGDIQKARERIFAGKYNGSVSVAEFDGKHLPYVDNMVNLLVCTKQYSLSKDEILRVLCPGGVAFMKDGKKITKAWPDNYDEWTHYLHGADNNAVSDDTAITAPIKHLQWKGSPKYSRHHDKSSSMPAAVTANGRIFYIMDEGPRASILWEPKWQLAARDAFNGVILWRKDIEQWTSHLWPLKSGPSNTPRRLVAVDDYVYATLGLLSTVSKLGATNGSELKTYAGTEKTEEIICKDGVLYLVINPDIDATKKGGKWEKSPKKLMAVKESDGTVLWRKELSWIAPCTMTVGAERVFVCDGRRILAFESETGEKLWESPALPQRNIMPTYFAPTLVAAPGLVLYVGGEDWKEHAGSKGLMTCLDAATGQIKWQQPHLPSGYQSPQDIFVIGGRAWSGSLNSKPGEFDERYPDVSPSTGEFISYNLQTGAPGKSIPRGADSYWFHHRCHRAKATKNFFLTSRTGIEMIDLQSGEWSLHHWIRGACLYGIMPANGLIYAPPHPCACYPEAKLTGFNAVSGLREADDTNELINVDRLLKGPAYGYSAKQASSNADWPTFRGNAARSGSTNIAVESGLGVKWEAKIGGKLSQPVAADGKVLVAAVDEHTLHAINQASGKTEWKYITGGRIDSPPTIYKGMALFGSADGYVYCLRVSDGALAWRFRAAPYDQRIMSNEQLESVWPVHGSVLVRDDVAYVVAGRSMFLDNGMTLYRLNPLTGKVLSSEKMDAADPTTGKSLQSYVSILDMPVASPDILSSEGDLVFMRSQPFNLEGKRQRVEHIDVRQQQGDDAHLFVPNGFLDDDWWHRSFWVYGRSVQGGPSYWETGNATPSGKLMVLDEENLYIFGRQQEYWRWTAPTEYRLFSVERSMPRAPVKPVQTKKNRAPKIREKLFESRWSVAMPVLVQAMVKAADTIFVAGCKDISDEKQAFKLYDDSSTQASLKEQARLFAGDEGSVLWAVSAKDGSKQKEIELDVLPVFDGMIAAGGELFMATVDGKVICLGTAKQSI